VVAELDSAVAAVALFGSWAARYHGEPRPEPADLDVLVVVTSAGLDRGPLYAAVDPARRRLGRRSARPSSLPTDGPAEAIAVDDQSQRLSLPMMPPGCR
jgi:hypothetical protein